MKRLLAALPPWLVLTSLFAALALGSSSAREGLRWVFPDRTMKPFPVPSPPLADHEFQPVAQSDLYLPALDVRDGRGALAGLGAEPAALVFSEAGSRAPWTVSTVVYAQLWADLAIADVSCSLEPARWKVLPADAATKRLLDAKVAYRLEVTLPAAMAPGADRGVLRVKAQRDSGPSLSLDELEIAVSGRGRDEAELINHVCLKPWDERTQ
jgi:hypothetical protein